MPNATFNDFQGEIQTWVIRWNQYRLAANIPMAFFTSTFMGEH